MLWTQESVAHRQICRLLPKILLLVIECLCVAVEGRYLHKHKEHGIMRARACERKDDKNSSGRPTASPFAAAQSLPR